MAYVITVNGCMGSGKSSVCKYLSEKYEDVIYFPERYEENAYIEQVYDYGKQYSEEYLKTDKYYSFLVWECQRRSVMLANQNVLNAKSVKDKIIALVDIAPIYTVDTFASVAENKGYLHHLQKSELLDVALSTRKYITINWILTAPPNVLKERIESRGRQMEFDISLEYLTDLCFAAYYNYRGKEWDYLSTENRSVEEVAEDLYEEILFAITSESKR